MQITADMIRQHIQQAADQGHRIASPIEMADGQRMSVQASSYHHCTPRGEGETWTEVECGYPTAPPGEAMMEYAESPEDPTQTVYPYVPIEVVVDEINAHGGEVKTPRPNQSLSHGTLRRQDLIPTFMDALKVYAPTEYEAYVVSPVSPIPSYVYDEGDDSEWWDSEEAGWLLEELFDALEGAAPDGCTFGAHEGDGSDFGFWMIEEGDDNE